MSASALHGRVVAREHEIGEVCALLVDGPHRVVTLTGIGGAGKTTIATHVVAGVADRFPDGVWRVDLAPGSAESLPHRTALALGLADQHREPVDVLADFVAPRHALLVLDNCEHLVEEVADLLSALLTSAPDLRVLATSRVPLRVTGERIYPVPPLAVPAPDAARVDDLVGVPSVDLFVDRARATWEGFTVTERNAAAVADICRRLEGIPLALEVAAGSLIALPVEEVRARVAAGDESPVELRGRPAHQRTVRATLDWSVGLLDAPERTLLRRLAVFTGGWAPDAVTPVCSVDGDLGDALGILVTLVEHSLVARAGRGAETRYRLLEPVRQYAAELLAASGEAERISRNHALHHLAVAAARRGGPPFLVPEDVTRIDADRENCTSALRWAAASGAADVERGLLLALSEYWRVRGLLRVGRAHYEQAIDRMGEDEQLLLQTLFVRSNSAQLLGDPDAAVEAAQRAVDLATRRGDTRDLWSALGMLGNGLADRGDLEGARAAYERARTLLPTTGASAGEGFYFANTGDFALRCGDLADAQARLERAREVFTAGPRMWFAGRVLVQLGEVARRRGDLERAEHLVLDGLARLVEYGALVEAVPSLEELALVEAGRGLPELATLVLGAASCLREEVGLGSSPDTRGAVEALLDRLRDALGPRFLEAWTAGRQAGLEGALAAAADHEVPPVPSAAGGPALTPRERQVAELVAQGLTNRAVAERLGMAPGTARSHVERILAKLGLTSRVQVATWVVTAGEDRPER